VKILYCGNFRGVPYSTENDIASAFRSLGHTVTEIQENQPNVSEVERYDYDLLLMTGTWDINLEFWLTVFHRCAELNIPTATVHLDTFWSTSRDNRQWFLHPMFYTQHVFTADGDYDQMWANRGINHHWLPPAVRHSACHMGKPRDEYLCDLAFVGNNGQGYHPEWPYRRELVDKLREISKKNGWVFRNPGGDHPKIERGDDLNDFYASCKVTVGDSLCLKKESSRYWSDRNAEVWGRYGLVIMPQIDALEELYDGHIPMYDWGDWEQLELLIRRYMGDPELSATVIKTCAEITAQHHTYVNRVETILETIF
jgi:hypothetical protein